MTNEVKNFTESAEFEKMVEIGIEWTKKGKELDLISLFNETQFRLHSKMMELFNNKEDHDKLMKKCYINAILEG